jgi:FAD/FMN-containing dehydrogenase
LAKADAGVWLSDVQTRLQPIRVAGVVQPRSTVEVQKAVRRAARQGIPVSVSGGRHAQGGQQFAKDALHVDMDGMDRILGLDRGKGIVHAEAGIQWPALITELAAMQGKDTAPWGIVQKQTGADKLSLGGALAANIHGRGLALAPIIQDVEAFMLVDAQGAARTCSRRENADLFCLAIGGYGLFGIVTEVWLRLRRRATLERIVEVVSADDLIGAMERCVRDGFLYGDFQYATDPASEDFLARGVFSCYRPAPGRKAPAGQRALSQEDWDRLVGLAHHDRTAAFQHYCAHYLATSGQLYDSDQHQLATYLDDYHQRLDAATGSTPACEVISELYVPRPRLPAFLADVRAHFRSAGEAPIYGTIRLIEKDEASFLAWAREPWACTIVNLHVEHTTAAVQRAQGLFRALYDIALAHGGSFYLTYHAWATREQVERAHPRLREFFSAKRQHDPEGRFQSEWHRQMVALFGDGEQA